MDLIQRNKDMLLAGKYNIQDTRQLSRVASLANPNDYDLYLIACALCNYDIPDKAEARELRMQLFLKISNSDEDYSHKESDYGKIETKLKCKNTGKTNKYGLYEYELNVNDRDLVSDLWEYKSKDCLKYVDNKTFSDKIIISIGKTQIDNFKDMLTKLGIAYENKDLNEGIIFTNRSTHKLIDVNSLDLPFMPYDYQLEDAEKILKTKRALLGHEMGCGKTLISILIGESIKMPKLVICPESLRLNWYKEIKQAKNDSDVQILYSNESPHFGKDWTIVGYLTANKFLPNLKKFKCIFVDECQNCKAVNNWGKATSKRANSVMELAQNAEYCYLLSGTPLPSHNRDLYNILKMLKCEKFDFNNQWAFKHFADKFCDPKETAFGKDYSGNSNSNELHTILSALMVRRLKREVLPNLKKQRQFIPIEPKFKRDYKDIEKRLFKPEEKDTYMGLAMTGRQILSSYKFDTAVELAETVVNADESVVIVTNFIETADRLKEYFGDDACEIRGGMSDKDKQQSIEDFQNKKKSVCILNMQAGGVGITLTASHTMIVLDYAWLPSDMIQVEDRICRNGQTEPCMIYYVYCENAILDSLFIDMISNKSENIDLVVDNSANTFDLNAEKNKSATFIDQLKHFLGTKTEPLPKKRAVKKAI